MLYPIQTSVHIYTDRYSTPWESRGCRKEYPTRRMRKKRRICEFQELGFRMRIRLVKGTDQDAFWLSFIALIESLSLSFGGGGEHGFVAAHGRGSVEPAQRQAVIDWLGQQSCLTYIYVEDLIDAWYGDFDTPMPELMAKATT